MEETIADSESIAYGTMQHKVWRLGEQQKTITTKDRLLNKVRDPGRHKSEAHDQEIMIILTLGV